MSQLITRRRFTGSATAFAGSLMAAPALRAAGQRPNIILCMGDDHGWYETGYNGHPHLQTPVLDEMAETGLRLDRFYSAAPVCSPTRSSVLTGRHPNRCGTFSANWSTRPEEITIAHILSRAGYACGHFGKWHVGPVKAGSPTNPGAMGFDEWLSHDNFFEMNPTLSRNGGPPEKFQGESSELVIEEAIRFIGQAKRDGRPSFTVVWFGSPHEPYSGLERDLALYRNLPEKYKRQTVRITDQERGVAGEFPLDQVLQARFAEITAMDRAMGQLRQYLLDEELRENTLLWYCGDNGVPSEGQLDSPLRNSKGAVYEGGVRVPGLIEWPARIPKGRTSGVNSVTSDMLPTICDLVGEPAPDRPLDGISLRPLIDGEMERRPKPICFWEYQARRESEGEPYIDPKLQEGTTPLVKKMAGRFTRTFRNFHHPEISAEDYSGARAVLGNRYKLVVDGDGAGPAEDEAAEELFDMRAGQSEDNNLIESKQEVAEVMGGQLREWQRSVLESLTSADYD